MKKTTNLNSILNDINKYSKIIKESYVFDDDDMPNQEGNEDVILNDEDESLDVSKSAEDRINEIRSIALEGIQEFAEEVDSEEYNVFKNIWMTCDKFYTSKNKDNEELK